MTEHNALEAALGRAAERPRFLAGAEAAGALAASGAEVVVFDQNARPYGKIEDGLPRWHVALRNKEYGAIGKHLSRWNIL